MHKLLWMCGIGVIGACAATPDSDQPGTGEPGDVETSVATSNSFAYTPMGFARIADSGGGPTVSVGFDSASTLASAVTVSGSAGNYAVTFAGLGTSTAGDALGGNVQVTAEGTDNVRCRILNWSGAPDVSVSVQCTTPGGTLAASGFAVLFFRYSMPAVNTLPTSAAYMYKPANGLPPTRWDYNSRGTHNSVSGTGGSYTVTVPGASAVNASMMVTSYGSIPTGGAACSIGSWGSDGSNLTASIECRNAANQLVETAFSFSYSTTGPARTQQGAHAWFNGSSASGFYSSALGKVELCSSASVTGSRSGSLVTIVVSGDLGSWDASPFLRASIASKYGGAGYCKVETLTASGVAPSSTATTTLRCYDATGAAIAAPQLTFTHVTSDAAGPC